MAKQKGEGGGVFWKRCKKLILFSLPLIGAYLLQSLYSMADMLIVSRLAGTCSMSAVNIVAQVGQVVTGVAFGFLSGTTVIVAQYLGAGKRNSKRPSKPPLPLSSGCL